MKKYNLKPEYIRKIRPNRYQPRLVFNEQSISDLAQSIKENGLIQPIVVRDMIDYYEDLVNSIGQEWIDKIKSYLRKNAKH